MMLRICLLPGTGLFVVSDDLIALKISDDICMRRGGDAVAR